MDVSEFRKRGKEMVDYIADYMENVQTRRVLPEVTPGYLREMLPPRAPKKGESWESIMKDVDRVIMPGITHWQHPRFHAYFPAGNSWPSVLADMLSDSLGVVGFSWAASPACTELETVVLDWLAKMIGLPPVFLHETGIGGGVIQGSASECVLVSLLAARHQAIKDLKAKHPFMEEGVLLGKLVGYCSKLAHSCVEKAGMISMVTMRELEIDGDYSLRGHTLQKAIDEDRKMGLIPFYCCATIGTTAVCSFDNLHELGLVCEKEGLWLHVDAAYAGSALICPENHVLIKGIEHAHSFNFNPNKWLLVNFDCSTMWVRDRKVLVQALTVDPLYLQHCNSDKAIDFRHWGIPLSRRFRSLKLWFVLRSYGIEGLQKYVREHCRLAKKFEVLVKTDDRFEVLGKVCMGLVCFRLKGQNYKTQMLLRAINMSGKIHMVPALINDDYVIRFAICAQNANEDDIHYAWNHIGEVATDVLTACDAHQDDNEAVREIERIESLDIDDKEIQSSELPLQEDIPQAWFYKSSKEDINRLQQILKPQSGQILFVKQKKHLLQKGVSLQLIFQDGGQDGAPCKRPPHLENERLELEESGEEDDVFLYDNNIPSIPSISGQRYGSPVLKNGATWGQKRNKLLRMISDPKCYNPRILKSLSTQSKRHRSETSSQGYSQGDSIDQGNSRNGSEDGYYGTAV